MYVKNSGVVNKSSIKSIKFYSMFFLFLEPDIGINTTYYAIIILKTIKKFG